MKKVFAGLSQYYTCIWRSETRFEVKTDLMGDNGLPISVFLAKGFHGLVLYDNGWLFDGAYQKDTSEWYNKSIEELAALILHVVDMKVENYTLSSTGVLSRNNTKGTIKEVKDLALLIQKTSKYKDK